MNLFKIFFTLTFFFFAISLSFAQYIEIQQDTVYDGSPSYDPDFPESELHASFQISGMLTGTSPDPDPISVTYNIIDVSLPTNWSFTSANFMLGAGIFDYPPIMGTIDIPEEEFMFIDLNLFEFDQGGNVVPGQLSITVAFSTATQSDTLTMVVGLCPDNGVTDLIMFDEPDYICEGTSISFSAPEGYVSYNWSDGSSGSTAQIEISIPFIALVVEDEMGCLFNDLAFIDLSIPANQTLCFATIDQATGRNKLLWEKIPDQHTESFNIYKQGTSANIYDLVASQAFDDFSEYIDEASMPTVQSERYQVTAINICGTESSPIGAHKTMHLTSNLGINGEVNLIWEKYEGFDYGTFNIYRGSAANGLSLIAERPSNTFTYTDLTPPAGNLFYQIEIVAPVNCEPSEAVNTVNSNIAQINNTVDIDELIASNLSIFPNPASDLLRLNGLSEEYVDELEIYNYLGQLQNIAPLIVGSGIEFNIVDLSPGYYTIKIAESRTLSFIKMNK